jgi:hypothetical protein
MSVRPPTVTPILVDFDARHKKKRECPRAAMIRY